MLKRKLPIGKYSDNPVKYIREGGSFCRSCRIAFTFEETKLLFEQAMKKGTTGPRCPYCNRSLTTRTRKGTYHNLFWKKLREKKNASRNIR